MIDQQVSELQKEVSGLTSDVRTLTQFVELNGKGQTECNEQIKNVIVELKNTVTKCQEQSNDTQLKIVEILSNQSSMQNEINSQSETISTARESIIGRHNTMQSNIDSVSEKVNDIEKDLIAIAPVGETFKKILDIMLKVIVPAVVIGISYSIYSAYNKTDDGTAKALEAQTKILQQLIESKK